MVNGQVSIEQLVALAREAGRAIQSRVALRSAAETKADGSPITECDRASHEIIVAGLRTLDPDTPIISEEAAWPAAEERARWTRWWLVDPLDGTKEFVAGLPDYTVNIALIEQGVPTMGVVDAPAHGATYWSVQGHGAWRQTGDAEPVRIYARPPAAGSPLRVIESLMHRSSKADDFARQWPVSERVTIGSSLKFCRIAEGHADVYPRFSPIMEWDVAAGDCVFRDSGQHGRLYSPLTYGRPDLRVPPFVVGFTPPPAAVVWFTGLPGSGKTTIAREVSTRLQRMGSATEQLDGDEIRDLFPGTGFSRDARDSHVRRVGHVASRLEAHGITSLVSLVSPYRESRDFVRRISQRFIEVHVSTPSAECERRDPKGLYRRARAGEVAQLTGVADPYEAPLQPELTIDTTTMSVEAAADRVMDVILTSRHGGQSRSSQS
jgi:3'(2'), 5'-bisphosphate nucleotidase